MIRDNSKCVLCRRCAAVCRQWQDVGVIGANERGFKINISCAFEAKLGETSCVSCGQCIVACPTGALMEKDYTAKVWEALNDPEKDRYRPDRSFHPCYSGRGVGMPIGSNVEGKMVAALRRMGFDGVFDTDFSADLTIMEEANEFVERVQNGGVLPMITSCSPRMGQYCEHYFPDLLPHLSSCKSPPADVWRHRQNLVR